MQVVGGFSQAHNAHKNTSQQQHNFTSECPYSHSSQEPALGLVKELAIYHAKKGGDVILVARRKEALEALKAQIEADYNVKAHVFTADLSKAGAAQALYDEVKKAGHEVNILMNNAGKRTNQRDVY